MLFTRLSDQIKNLSDAINQLLPTIDSRFSQFQSSLEKKEQPKLPEEKRHCPFHLTIDDQVALDVGIILNTIRRVRSNLVELEDKIKGMKMERACRTCSQNYKSYKMKVEALEAKATRYEERADQLMANNMELFDTNRKQQEEIQQLQAQVKELSWKPSLLQSQISQICNSPPQW